MYINDHFSQAKYLYNAYLKDNLTLVCTVIYISEVKLIYFIT